MPIFKGLGPIQVTRNNQDISSINKLSVCLIFCINLNMSQDVEQNSNNSGTLHTIFSYSLKTVKDCMDKLCWRKYLLSHNFMLAFRVWGKCWQVLCFIGLESSEPGSLREEHNILESASTSCVLCFGILLALG